MVEYIERRNNTFYFIGSRVPLEVVVYEFQNGATAECIQESFDTLTLEQVYGGIAFYLGHKEEVAEVMRETERLQDEWKDGVPPELEARFEQAREQMKQRR